MSEQIKSMPLLILLQKFIEKIFKKSKFILTQFTFAFSPAFYFNMRGKKSYENIYYFLPQNFIIRGNILITIMTFGRINFLLASNRTFMIWYNLDPAKLK